jgi:hypothetical protein
VDRHDAVTDPVKRERAALDILALLPEWWAVGPTSYDPGVCRWSVTARGPHPGRGKSPATITGTGEDELAAMVDLRILLDERRHAEKPAQIDRRGRVAFLEDAEAQSEAAEGRSLTAEEWSGSRDVIPRVEPGRP